MGRGASALVLEKSGAFSLPGMIIQESLKICTELLAMGEGKTLLVGCGTGFAGVPQVSSQGTQSQPVLL